MCRNTHDLFDQRNIFSVELEVTSKRIVHFFPYMVILSEGFAILFVTETFIYIQYLYDKDSVKTFVDFLGSLIDNLLCLLKVIIIKVYL